MAATSSLWTASRTEASRPPLIGDVRCDVAVIGAGIVGTTMAYLMARDGADVVLLEAASVGSGTTGHTTAKVSSAHGLCYADIERSHGAHTSAAYARLNERAIDLIDQIRQREQIDCSWRRRDAFIYATEDSAITRIADEVNAARAAGLNAELVHDTPLPFPVAAAMKVPGQAEFHPVDWIRGLAAAAEQHGARIFEGSRATDVSDRPGRSDRRITTAGGTVVSDHVILATHYPTLDRGLFFARMSVARSYCLAVRSSVPAPEGMFLSVDDPARSLRTHAAQDGELLIVGGEGHKVGEESRTANRFDVLESWARAHLSVTSVEHRWSAQDAITPDHLPYVGAINPLSPRVLVATGFAKWGMTNGTAAAAALRDRIAGSENDDAAIFDSNRFDPIAAGPGIAKHNAQVARHLIGDRLTSTADRDSLPRGSGAIVRNGLRRVAAYRDDAGALHELSATCTHLGCELRFNDAERSWDCPCHGSRFDAVDGGVLEGPAVRALATAAGSSANGDATPGNSNPAEKATS